MMSALMLLSKLLEAEGSSKVTCRVPSWSTQPQFSGQTLRPQAVDAVLSLLQFPTSEDYLEDLSLLLLAVVAAHLGAVPITVFGELGGNPVAGLGTLWLPTLTPPLQSSSCNRSALVPTRSPS
jgi:hypothetical protein